VAVAMFIVSGVEVVSVPLKCGRDDDDNDDDDEDDKGRRRDALLWDWSISSISPPLLSENVRDDLSGLEAEAEAEAGRITGNCRFNRRDTDAVVAVVAVVVVVDEEEEEIPNFWDSTKENPTSSSSFR
jgi:hypothetical protein